MGTFLNLQVSFLENVFVWLEVRPQSPDIPISKESGMLGWKHHPPPGIHFKPPPLGVALVQDSASGKSGQAVTPSPGGVKKALQVVTPPL